jgi:hypothetical protein
MPEHKACADISPQYIQSPSAQPHLGPQQKLPADNNNQPFYFTEYIGYVYPVVVGVTVFLIHFFAECL